MDPSPQAATACDPAPSQPPVRAAAGAAPIRHQLVAAGFLFALALGLRIPYVHPGLLHHDEAVLADAVERSYEQRTLLPTVAGRYGVVALNLAAYAPWHAVTGGRAASSCRSWGS
jgi:hypothetical protein